VYDILRRHGVSLKQSGADREEQISCPFHGKDTKPSARIYPESGNKHSHVWCFVCQKPWDVIGLWKQFEGFDEQIKFSQILASLERAFGLTPPEPPDRLAAAKDDRDEIEVQLLVDTCNRRLKAAKRAFDMRAFLSAGLVLDKIALQVEDESLPLTEAKRLLLIILDRIGTRERSCPAG